MGFCDALGGYPSSFAFDLQHSKSFAMICYAAGSARSRQ